jgi:hypothetical protein
MIEHQIKSFSKFKAGWSYGEGKCFTQDTIDRAIRVAKIGELHGLAIEVFPQTNGGITVSFQNDEHVLDITIKEDEPYKVEYEKGIGEIFVSECIGEYDVFTSEYFGEYDNLENVKKQIKWLTELN